MGDCYDSEVYRREGKCSNLTESERLPPYVFSIVNNLKIEARHRGEDIIDLGMGNPDGPTPKHIVDKLVRGVKEVEEPQVFGIKGHYAIEACCMRMVRAAS